MVDNEQRWPNNPTPERKPELAAIRPGVVCWSCRHFKFTGSTPAYSDLTPGDDATMGCQQGIWDLDFIDDTQEDFERKMKTAETCEEFEGRS